MVDGIHANLIFQDVSLAIILINHITINRTLTLLFYSILHTRFVFFDLFSNVGQLLQDVDDDKTNV